MLYKFVLLALFASLSAAEVIRSVPCANTTIHSTDVQMEVSGCTAEDEFCQLVKGTNHTVNLHFTPTSDFTSRSDFRVHGVFDKFTVPYGSRSNACNNATTSEDETCVSLDGFKTGKRFNHLSIFPVSSRYPTLKLKVRFSILEKRTKEVLICQEVKVQIVNPVTTTTEA